MILLNLVNKLQLFNLIKISFLNKNFAILTGTKNQNSVSSLIS